MQSLPQIIEALLQASEEPLSTEALLSTLQKANQLHLEEEEHPLFHQDELEQSSIIRALEELDQQLYQQQRATILRRRPGGWKLVTRAEYAPYIRGLYPDTRPTRLSSPALETLAIIAYRQPVTKAEIEAVRGVSVDAMVQKLLDLGFARIQGRADRPGRPLLFATTSLFLEHFGIEAKEMLPNHDELARIQLPEPEQPSAQNSDPNQPEFPLDTPTN